MNVELSGTLLSLIVIIFGIGSAWGTVKFSMRKYKDDKEEFQKQIEELKGKIKDIGDCDKIIRGYLFGLDSTPYFVPTTTCFRSHEKSDEQLKELNKKTDEQFKELNKKFDELLKELRK